MRRVALSSLKGRVEVMVASSTSWAVVTSYSSGVVGAATVVVTTKGSVWASVDGVNGVVVLGSSSFSLAA